MIHGVDLSSLGKAQAACTDNRDRFDGWVEYLGVEYRVDAFIDDSDLGNERVDAATYEDETGRIDERAYPALIKVLDGLTIEKWRKHKAAVYADAVAAMRRTA